jgi:hypothetical protein
LQTETYVSPMANKDARLHPGDLVEVKTPGEILRTLDENGAQDGLPFMPEMMQFCGKRFHVAQRVVKTCYYTLKGSSGMRKFREDDVVTLEEVRCSGAAHDGCQKGCLVFWREAWLRKLEAGTVQLPAETVVGEQLRAHLKTMSGPNTYFCQSSEILKATDPLPRWERFGKCVEEVREGNCGTVQMMGRLGVWLFWKIRKIVTKAFADRNKKSAPSESQNLQPGEAVEVKSAASIAKTLDADGHHRGLSFMPGMRQFCTQQRRVERKVEKIIVDGTGEMRQLRNTVYLEGALCGCAHVALGGCPRGEFAYWREIWLQRASDP